MRSLSFLWAARWPALALAATLAACASPGTVPPEAGTATTPPATQRAAPRSAAGVSPILELGLIQRQARMHFYDRASREGAAIRVQLLDAPPDVRWERVQRRNETRGETFSMAVSRQVFDVASAMWEPPDEDEIREHGIEVLAQR